MPGPKGRAAGRTERIDVDDERDPRSSPVALFGANGESVRVMGGDGL
jgi:hypothetical protein